MRKAKSLIVLISLIAVEISESTQIKIFYVLPDNSTNVSCPSQPCATLSQYLMDNNNTLPAVSNVEYHFLSGKHYIPANLILHNLYNFTIIGVVSKSSLFPVLISHFHSFVLKIYDSHHVNIRNIEFDHYYKQQLQHITGLYILRCFSCILDKLILNNFGIIAHNLIENSYLNEIHIQHTKELLCQGITLQYWDDDQLLNNYDEYHLLINKLKITGNRNGSRCYNFNDMYSTGVYMNVTRNVKNVTVKSSTITITNSLFKEIFHTAIHVKNKCATNKISFLINNCTFYSNTRINAPLIEVSSSSYNKLIVFKNCKFYKNCGIDSLVYIRITDSTEIVCMAIPTNQDHTFSTSIYFKECKFTYNTGNLLTIVDGASQKCKIKLSIKGPVYITENKMYHWNNKPMHTDLISFEKVAVHIFGPLFISHNYVTSRRSVFSFKSSEVTFYDTVIFSSNKCGQIIILRLKYTYIRVMEYSDVTFIPKIS